jgi:hypothetical protein
MCDHGEGKDTTYLPIFNDVGEVYMCECGALIDIANPKNFKEPSYAMTAAELNEALRDLINGKIDNLLHDAEFVFKNHRVKRQV